MISYSSSTISVCLLEKNTILQSLVVLQHINLFFVLFNAESNNFGKGFCFKFFLYLKIFFHFFFLLVFVYFVVVLIEKCYFCF